MRSTEPGRVMEHEEERVVEVPLEDLLRALDERGGTGLDLSPGDPVCRAAASRIRELWKRVQEKVQEKRSFRLDERVSILAAAWRQVSGIVSGVGDTGREGYVVEIQHPLYKVRLSETPGEGPLYWVRSTEIELAPPAEEATP